jgi:molybdopterin converting factor small subunit
LVVDVFLYDCKKYEVIIDKMESNLREIIIELVSAHPKLCNIINMDELESLVTYHNTILKGDEILNLDSVLKDCDEIMILPILCGG